MKLSSKTAFRIISNYLFQNKSVMGKCFFMTILVLAAAPKARHLLGLLFVSFVYRQYKHEDDATPTW